MKHETERFWKYLLEGKDAVLTQKEIKEIYNKFIRQWKEKDNFKKVFRNLQISKIRYMLNKKWLVLTEEQLTELKQGKIQENFLFFYFLNTEKIPWYLGLATAKYCNKLTWQSQRTIYIINTKYQLKRKVGNNLIKFIKIPKELFLKKSFLYFEIKEYKTPYSDREKTLLDEIYFKEYKKFKLQIMDYEDLDLENINYYLFAYYKYPLVKAHLIELLGNKQLKQLK